MASSLFSVTVDLTMRWKLVSNASTGLNRACSCRRLLIEDIGMLRRDCSVDSKVETASAIAIRPGDLWAWYVRSTNSCNTLVTLPQLIKVAKRPSIVSPVQPEILMGLSLFTKDF